MVYFIHDKWLRFTAAAIVACSWYLYTGSMEKEYISKEADYLLSLTHLMAGVKDRDSLLQVINGHFKKLVDFTYSVTLLLSPDRQTFSMFLLDPASLSAGHPDYVGIVTGQNPSEDCIFNKALTADLPVVWDIAALAAGDPATTPAYIRMFHASGVQEAVSAGLWNDREKFGLLVLYSDRKGTVSPSQLSIIKGMANLVSIAVSNILANEGLRAREKEKEALLAISHEMAKIRDKNQLLSAINTSLKNLFYFTHSSIAAINDDRETFTVFLTDPGSRSKDHPEFIKMITAKYPINDGLFNTFLQTDEPTVSDIEKNYTIDWMPRYTKIHYEAGLREAISVPMHGEKEIFGILTFYSDKKKSFTADNISIIKGVTNQVAVAVSNILAHEKIIRQLEEISTYRQQLEQENQYLQQQINTTFNYDEIIGQSPAMQRVYQLLSQVAFADSTVLILGETGTGKELVARAIHNASSRKNKLMIKVNCAALPASLIESALFGHEKGSFTGAIERRIGKFEMANNSTLFLDEIGELPPELQVKLLRVLQERELERVGGQTTIKVDVRIIAATNRSLSQEVASGRFRMDLFYRLNVFPVELPPLRDRKEDLPALIHHFINRYATNTGKKVNRASEAAMRQMYAYNWPGNVRELEHIIERSVLLADGNIIRSVPLPSQTQSRDASNDNQKVKTLDEAERDYIISILRRCQGKIQGVGGAAELLGIPPTTLHSKIKKLHIKKIYKPEQS